MTIGDYIKGKFQSFGINLSEAEILDITINGQIEADALLDSGNIADADLAFVKYIPTALMRPNVSESGFSVTMPDDGRIKAFYSLKCKELGIENKLASSITDVTNHW